MHTHLIPRRFKDLSNSDDIYALIESEAGDLGKVFREGESSRSTTPGTPPPAAKIAVEVNKELVLSGETQSAVSIAADNHESSGERPKFPTPLPDELRKPRTVEDMEKEAKMLAKFMAEYDNNSKL